MTLKDQRRLGGSRLRFDLYTKTILTIIAVLLAISELRSIVQPVQAIAQDSFNGLQFSGSQGWFYMFDSKTGDAWLYDMRGKVRSHLKFTQPGEPAIRK